MIKKTFVVCLLLMLGGIFSPLFAATPIMVQKNLFSEDRKAPLPQSGSTSSEQAGQGLAIGDIQLDGVVFRNNLRTALLRLKNVPIGPTGQRGSPPTPVVTVRVGEMVKEYRVTKIEIQSVTLEKSGQAYTLGLFSSNKVATPATAGAPPPPGGNSPSPGSPLRRLRHRLHM